MAVHFEKLYQSGINVNAKDNLGWTPLHEACLNGWTDIIEELIKFQPCRTVTSYFSAS